MLEKPVVRNPAFSMKINKNSRFLDIFRFRTFSLTVCEKEHLGIFGGSIDTSENSCRFNQKLIFASHLLFDSLFS
jgi:hypothetical protein